MVGGPKGPMEGLILVLNLRDATREGTVDPTGMKLVPEILVKYSPASRSIVDVDRGVADARIGILIPRSPCTPRTYVTCAHTLNKSLLNQHHEETGKTSIHVAPDGAH